MATVGFGAGQTQVQQTPGSTVNTQKSAKEQALAYQQNLSDKTYLQQAQTAAYGAATSYEKDAFGASVPVWDATTPKYLGIDANMQKYGYVPYTRPTPPAANAPEEKWAEYTKAMQGAIKPPMYTNGAQYTAFQNMDTASVKAWQQRAMNAGLYSKNDMVVPGVPSKTDYDIMAKMMGQGNLMGDSWENMMAVNAQGKKGGAGASSTSTQISYSQTSIASGRSLLQKTLGDAIGRNPTDIELKRYMKMLHDAESNSPTRTVTTSGGGTSVSRTTPTDVDPNDMALQFAKEIGGGDPYRERQASHYLDLIVNRAGVNYA